MQAVVAIETKPAEPKPAEPVAMIDYDPVVEPVDECDVPSDPPTYGDATLRIRLRGDSDGAPVAMTVRLWQLGVAASEHWTDGDELWTEIPVPTDGVSIAHLPPGRYRLQCLDLRNGGADPPEFSVGHGESEMVVVVAHRRTAHLRLFLVDAHGSPIRTAVCCERGGSSSSPPVSEPLPPAWVHRRSPRVPVRSRGVWFIGGVTACGFGEPTGVRVDVGGLGSFDLGTQVERGRHGYRMRDTAYVTEAGNVVRLHTEDTIGVDTTFIGVAARTETLVAHVVYPDGSKFDPSTGTIDARCDAMQFAWTPSADAWRNVVVHVEISRFGYEPLRFDWTAATADAEHRLVAIPPESPK
jgi:hypothetical protein